MLQDRLGLSERRACQIAGQHRSTQRHEPKPAPEEAALREISAWKPRWGYRRAHARLLAEGWSVRRKRVQRLWREEDLRVPVRKRERARLGASDADPKRLSATHPNHVWALDFQTDETADGRQLRIRNVVDEFTREALASECERSIGADRTVAVPERLVRERGATPEHVRMDNGPELTAHALRDWCRSQKGATAYVEPGSPWQNPYVESFNARMRDEVLDVELFSSLAEAKLIIEGWRAAYNAEHRTRRWRCCRQPSSPPPGSPLRSSRRQREARGEGRLGAAPDGTLRSPCGLAPRGVSLGRYRGSRYRSPTLTEGGPRNGGRSRPASRPVLGLVVV